MSRSRSENKTAKISLRIGLAAGMPASTCSSLAHVCAFRDRAPAQLSGRCLLRARALPHGNYRPLRAKMMGKLADGLVSSANLLVTFPDCFMLAEEAFPAIPARSGASLGQVSPQH
ncbi:integral membrane protein [Anopheles sinensis]|uniref:Integral membrane protein n=1 Tax=Anopheles sinensis TaxID=74873 RepID=A0A084VU25_ANOSI|nr:integral membrane protein [Anopheles sinensis]